MEWQCQQFLVSAVFASSACFRISRVDVWTEGYWWNGSYSASHAPPWSWCTSDWLRPTKFQSHSPSQITKRANSSWEVQLGSRRGTSEIIIFISMITLMFLVYSNPEKWNTVSRGKRKLHTWYKALWGRRSSLGKVAYQRDLLKEPKLSIPHLLLWSLIWAASGILEPHCFPLLCPS